MGSSDGGMVDFAGIVLSSKGLHVLDHTAKSETESVQRSERGRREEGELAF